MSRERETHVLQAPDSAVRPPFRAVVRQTGDQVGGCASRAERTGSLADRHAIGVPAPWVDAQPGRDQACPAQEGAGSRRGGALVRVLEPLSFPSKTGVAAAF